MKRYQLIAALAAFIITFILCTVLKGCTVKAGAKQKEEATGSEKSEAEATEGARPLAGLSLVLKKAAEQRVNVAKMIMEWWQQEKEKRARRQKDINLTAELIFWENWYTDKNKEAAYDTGAVAWNRVKSPEFPNTLEEVLYQKGQYSTTKYFFTKELPKECYEMAEDIVMNGTPDVPETVLFQATFKQGKVWKVINGEYFCYG